MWIFVFSTRNDMTSEEALKTLTPCIKKTLNKPDPDALQSAEP